MAFKITLVDWIDNVNLHTVTANIDVLRKHVKTYALKENQAVVFANKANDRARLVLNLGGTPVLIILPTHEVRSLRLSLLLTVSGQLRALQGSRATLAKVDQAIDRITVAADRSKKRRAV